MFSESTHIQFVNWKLHTFKHYTEYPTPSMKTQTKEMGFVLNRIFSFLLLK